MHAGITSMQVFFARKSQERFCCDLFYQKRRIRVYLRVRVSCSLEVRHGSITIDEASARYVRDFVCSDTGVPDHCVRNEEKSARRQASAHWIH